MTKVFLNTIQESVTSSIMYTCTLTVVKLQLQVDVRKRLDFRFSGPFSLSGHQLGSHRALWHLIFFQETLYSLQCADNYNDVIMSAIAFQITGVSIVSSIVCSCADQRRDQSCASLAFARGIHRWPVDFPHKGPVTRKMFHLMTSSWTNCSSGMVIKETPKLSENDHLEATLLSVNDWHGVVVYNHILLKNILPDLMEAQGYIQCCGPTHQ